MCNLDLLHSTSTGGSSAIHGTSNMRSTSDS
ncbi:Protein of unknown function [Pyronema omphalodes CBS 100304]|uniref:Uncharacterized protein n=1 Tax=Pyronema omphalodes (strain CBS 100304) TaxID=1076935 RepID=U4LFX2_PYROM|nr:Protein of unknown function [Pyronema omphalodes CBS 100304]